MSDIEKPTLDDFMDDDLDYEVQELPFQITVEKQQTKHPKKTDKEIDVENVRSNLYDACTICKFSIMQITSMTLGEMNKKARLFEVQAQLLKTYADISKSILDLHPEEKGGKTTEKDEEMAGIMSMGRKELEEKLSKE